MEILHKRLLTLLYGLHPNQFRRKLRTEVLGTTTLDIAIQRFVWHGQHHIAQIKSCITLERTILNIRIGLGVNEDGKIKN